MLLDTAFKKALEEDDIFIKTILSSLDKNYLNKTMDMAIEINLYLLSKAKENNEYYKTFMFYTALRIVANIHLKEGMEKFQQEESKKS